MVNALLRDNLVDILIVSIIPVLLGEGTRLFEDGRPEQRLRMAESKAFETGLVQVRYEKE